MITKTIEFFTITADSTMKTVRTTNLWKFTNGILSEQDSFCWDKEHSYAGKVW